MSDLPPNLSGSGPWPSHDSVNKLRAYAISNSSPSGAPGLRRRTFTGGTLMSPVPSKKTRSTPSPRTLLVYASSTDKIGVTFGQINGETPTLGGNPISDTPPPTLTVVDGTVYLHATIDGDGIITALTIENAASTPDNTSNDGYLTLALVTVASSVITNIQHAAWNLLQMQVCGSVADEGEVTTFLWGGFGE